MKSPHKTLATILLLILIIAPFAGNAIHRNCIAKIKSVSFSIAAFHDTIPPASPNRLIKVLELRNYVIKPGQRENFTQLFESHFIQSQHDAGSYVLGQYRIKDDDNHFFWIRGFTDMPSRKKALNDFYYGPVWKQYRTAANPMLVNNDNVNLLKPLNIANPANDQSFAFNTEWFENQQGIAVVDYYISNTKLAQLIEFVRKTYAPALDKAGIKKASFWVSELAENDFPQLPVFQDKDLLVQITFYKSESDYQAKINAVTASLSDEQKATLADLVTLTHSMVVYPTENTKHGK